MRSTTLDLFPDHTKIDESGDLYIGGCSILELVNQYGTPLYLFDENTIHNRSNEYLQALGEYYPGRSSVSYACKAGISIYLAQLIRDAGLDLDVVSGGELFVALKSGFPPERIHFHGNNKSREELILALREGVGRIVVDNFHELDLINDIELEKPIKIWLRLSPGVDAETHHYRKTGLIDSKFGFLMTGGDAERAVCKVLENPKLELAGLHMHIGSQITDLEPYRTAIQELMGFTKLIEAKYGLKISEFSPGGGWGIPSLQNPKVQSIRKYVKEIAATLLKAAEIENIPLPMLTLEPGRSIIGPAGVAVYKIGSRKEISGVRTYISVDGGMADNIRPALYNAKYSAYKVGGLDDSNTEIVTISGKFCESGDILIKDIELPFLEPGDTLVLPSAGAYSLAMGSNYNMSLKPPVVFLKDGNAILAQRREDFWDLISRDITLEQNI